MKNRRGYEEQRKRNLKGSTDLREKPLQRERRKQPRRQLEALPQ
jgi:hypothetical protein